MGGGEESTITKVFLLICLEGLCGGAAYVNAFYHVGRIGDDGEGKEDDDSEEGQRRKMEREFRIGATGGADSCGQFSNLKALPCKLIIQVFCWLVYCLCRWKRVCVLLKWKEVEHYVGICNTISHPPSESGIYRVMQAAYFVFRSHISIY